MEIYIPLLSYLARPQLSSSPSLSFSSLVWRTRRILLLPIYKLVMFLIVVVIHHSFLYLWRSIPFFSFVSSALLLIPLSSREYCLDFVLTTLCDQYHTQTPSPTLINDIVDIQFQAFSQVPDVASIIFATFATMEIALFGDRIKPL